MQISADQTKPVLAIKVPMYPKLYEPLHAKKDRMNIFSYIRLPPYHLCRNFKQLLIIIKYCMAMKSLFSRRF